MSELPKRQRVFLCVAKKTKYGWMGRLGGADIAISVGKKNPDDLIISMLERPMETAQPQQRQPPPRPPAPQRQPYIDHTRAPAQAPPFEDNPPWPEDDIPF